MKREFTTDPKLLGCPKCGKPDSIQRSNNVHVWERGAFDGQGEFIADDARLHDHALEIDWESQKPENYFYCLNCQALFRLDEDSTDPAPRFTVEP